MVWSEYFAVDTLGKIFALAGILIGFFSGVFLILSLLELLQSIISNTILTGCRNLRIRFIARVCIFWMTKIISLAVVLFAAIVITFADSPSSGGYVQINIFVFVGLFTTWRAIALWPELAHHVHCIADFANIKRAQFSSRHNKENTINDPDEIWSLIDANPHAFTYLISSPSSTIRRQCRKTTKETIPIGLFTTARYTVVHNTHKV